MKHIENLDKTIRRFYTESNRQVSEELIAAILYSIDGGGKRLRPRILLDVLEGFGLSVTQAHYQVAASLEMIHTGSLIHDDLPAMDDDDYRRGRLTNHKQFDEATAILAGDSLFLDAFGLLSQADVEAPLLLQLVQLLSQASGTFGMVGGQMLDMQGEGKKLDLADLEAIHVHKTGCLLAYPFQAAAILAKQERATIEKFAQIGTLIGHAFQVRDDLLDVTADFETLGKTPQKDLRSDKATYPSLLGLAASYALLQDKLDQATTLLVELEADGIFYARTLLTMIEDLRLHG